jgi:trans-aconitate 2-methyltransferase
VSFLHADLLSLDVEQAADVVFSTAALHWVLDHDRLFPRLFHALRPGGRLHAQCGGGDNVKRLRDRSVAILSPPPFAEHFARWREAWFFAWPEETAERLRHAGFVEVETGLEEVLPILPDAPTYRAFLANVVVPSYLEVLPVALQESYLDALVEAGAKDDPPWSLDYVRLNLAGRRP